MPPTFTSAFACLGLSSCLLSLPTKHLHVLQGSVQIHPPAPPHPLFGKPNLNLLQLPFLVEFLASVSMPLLHFANVP